MAVGQSSSSLVNIPEISLNKKKNKRTPLDVLKSGCRLPPMLPRLNHLHISTLFLSGLRRTSAESFKHEAVFMHPCVILDCYCANDYSVLLWCATVSTSFLCCRAASLHPIENRHKTAATGPNVIHGACQMSSVHLTPLSFHKETSLV